MQSFKEIQPAKWDSWDADSVDLVASNHWLRVSLRPCISSTSAHFWAPKAVTIAARSHSRSLTFRQHASKTALLNCAKSLRRPAQRASLWLRKSNFCSDPKISELLRIFRNFFSTCTTALSRGQLNQALQLPYIGESPFIYGVGNSRRFSSTFEPVSRCSEGQNHCGDDRGRPG